MDNALYYTFSTIAQALAAAVALLGAFVIVRLQQLSATLATSGQHVIRPLLPDKEARRLVDCALFDELAEYIVGNEAIRDVRRDAYYAAEHSFRRALASRRTIIRSWRRAMIASGLTIVGAVLALAFTPYLVHVGWASWALGIAILALTVTLCAQGRVLWVAVREA